MLLRAISASLVVLVAVSAGAWWFALRMPSGLAASHCEVLPASEDEIAIHLEQHVEYLAGRLGPRSAEQAAVLEAAGRYVEQQLERHGWRVVRQSVGAGAVFFNVIAEAGPPLPDARLLVIGAHYDSVAESPGADDNASGVAALLEIARLLAPAERDRIRLIGFTNEESPLGRTQLRGSRVAAAASRGRGEELLGMLSLESIGYFSDEAGSQRHPTLLGWLLPDTGNYLALVANPSSRALLHRTIAALRATSSVPTEDVVISPRLVRHVKRSDHSPYWDHGYPALMVTDTADFRNPNYHRASDLPGTLDLPRLANATLGIASMARCLAAHPGRNTPDPQ